MPEDSSNGINFTNDKSDQEQLSNENKFNVPAGKEYSETYQVKRVNQLHREIVRLIVLGYKDKEIATMLGCSAPTVRYVKNSDIVKTHLDKLHFDRDKDATDMQKTIKNFAPLALEVATSIMNDDSVHAGVRLNAAHDLLDRGGYKPVDVRANLGDGKVTKEELKEIKERARQSGVMFASDIEEASYEEVGEVSEKNGSNEADETNESNE